MHTTHTIVAQPPGIFAESEIQDVLAMVREGGEVGDAVLEENVRKAKCLVVARQDSCLVAVAALKNPKASYRKSIHAKSGVAVDAHNFPFEFGYLFVLPSARKRGIGASLCEAALSQAAGTGVFATARTSNAGMVVILPMFDFAKAGLPYASTRRGHQLQLYLRRAAPQCAAAYSKPGTPLDRG